MATQSLDPIEVAKVVAGMAVTPAIAAIVGPYAIILLAAFAGAAAKVGNRPPTAKGGPILFFVKSILIALLFTVPVATFVAQYNDSWEAQWFFGPTAALIAYGADRLKDAFDFFLEQIKVLIRNWANKGDPK